MVSFEEFSAKNQDVAEVNEELQIYIYVMFAFYIILIGATIHNIVRFVIRQKRWKSFHIAYFYVLVPMVTFVRVIWFISILIVTYSEQNFQEK